MMQRNRDEIAWLRRRPKSSDFDKRSLQGRPTMVTMHRARSTEDRPNDKQVADANPNMRIKNIRLPLLLAILLPTLCMLCVALAAWGLYLRSEWSAAVQNAYSKSSTTVQGISTDLEGVFRDYKAVLAELSQRPAIKQMSKYNCDPILPQFFELHKELLGVTIRDVTGRLICSSLKNASTYLPEQLAALYRETIKLERFSVTGAIQAPPSTRWVAAMTYPVYGDDGAIAGLVLASIDLNYFGKRIFSSDLGDTIVSVMSADLSVVLRSRDAESWLGKTLPTWITDAFRNGASGNFMVNDLQGVSRVGSFATVPSVGWKVALGYPTAEVLEPYERAIFISAVVGSCGILAALLLALLLARSTTRPVSRLVRVAGDVAAGKFQSRTIPGGPAEIANVGNQFNRMLDSLQQLKLQEHEATQALSESEERFRLLAGATSDVIWDWDLDTNMVWWSESLETQFGHSLPSPYLSIEASFELIADEDRQRIRDSVTSFLLGEKTVWRVEYGFKRADGTTAQVVGSGLVIRDELGAAKRMLGSIVDNTERLALELRLQQAQKLEAVGQLTGGIAHDFNNLLTIILGKAEILTDTLPEGSEELRLASRILAAAERGAELTDRLLAFARRQPLKPMLVNPATVVAGLKELLGRSLGEQVQLQTQSSATWTTFADAGQLEAATLNLVLNARDAMPDGGTILIRASDEILGDGSALGIPIGEYVVISVSDTGTGMSQDTLSKAFEPFFTTKEVGYGSGLGLSMVHGFLKQSGGGAKISSALGKGTTVSMYFPRVVGEVSPVQQNSNQFAIGGGESILVVEDDTSVAEYVVNQLRRAGYSVRVAHSGKDALAEIRADSDIALLFTDVVMPGALNGLQLADEATKLVPDLRVLFMSGYEDNVLMESGRLKPDVDLLHKPFNRAALLRSVQRALVRTQVAAVA